jgi:hypothetical protein
MLNKYLNLFIKENNFAIRLILIVVIVWVSLFLSKNQVKQKAVIIKLKQDKEFTSTIPGMQKSIKIIEAKLQEKEKPGIAAVEPVVSGILIRDSVAYALVGDDILKVGDSAGIFVVKDITSRTVTLANQETGLEKVYHLSE